MGKTPFLPTGNIVSVLEDRYLKKDDGKIIESPQQMLERVAVTIASAEKNQKLRSEWEQIFYEMMATQKYMPNSPCLMNAGREMMNLNACFVLPFEDSIDGIMKTASNTAKIQKSGGGTGFCMDKLRPTGDFIKSSGGKTSGPISFWRVLAEVTNAIQQGAFRRGANMMMCTLHHPDILKFIYIKQNLAEFTSYNISVKLTEEDIVNIRTNPDKVLKVINPRTKLAYAIPASINSGAERTVNGKKEKVILTYELSDLIPYEEVTSDKACWTYGMIYDLIVFNAWSTGEPGLFFIDRVNGEKNNPIAHVCEIEATNPCVTGDTKILTKDGYFEIKDLVGKEVEIWNGLEWSKVVPKITGHNTPIKTVKLSDGSELTCTDYHIWKTAIGKDVKTIDLRQGYSLQKFDMPVIYTGEKLSYDAYTYGFMCGDGQAKGGILLYGEKKELVSKFANLTIVREDKEYNRIYCGTTGYPEKFIVPLNSSLKDRLEWLAGLTDSDGTVCDNPNSQSIQISSINLKFLQDVKLMLTTLGCKAKIGICKEEQDKLMPNGKGGLENCHCQTCYRLCINAYDVVKLVQLGFSTHRVKLEKLAPNRDARRFITVESIIDDGIADTVYCFTEHKNHTGTFNGIVTGQCGEQPIPPYASCNLGSLNLSKFIIKPITEVSKWKECIDWEDLKKCIHGATRFLDNVIDVNKYPIPEIEKQNKSDRRIGLGVMGFADALFRLRVAYNSQLGFEIGNALMKFVNDESHAYSTVLAEEKGVFPYWEGSPLQKAGIKHRNCSKTTVAPTGTISIIADCSGGIEPLFSLVFKRKVLNGEVLMQGNQWFENAMDDARISDENKEKIREYCFKTGTLKGCPVAMPDWFQKVFVTARDISVEDHIRMQSEFQENCDASISKTINLPNTATIDDVKAAYNLAFDSRCKGITVYRDGCRSNQPMSLAESETKAPSKPKLRKKRIPNVSDVKLYRFQEPHGKIFVSVNFDPESKTIQEIFANTSRPHAIYAVTLNALSKVISKALRYGVPIEEFTDLMEFHDPDVKAPLGPFGITNGIEAFGKAIQFFKDGLYSEEQVVKDYRSSVTQLEKAREEYDKMSDEQKTGMGKCPKCGSQVYPSPGCRDGRMCPSCNWSTGSCS